MPDSAPPVADFQAHLIARLRQEKAAADDAAQAVVEATRANANNAARVHGLVLRLLDAQDGAGFFQALTLDSLAWLDVDAAALAMESGSGPIPLIPNGPLRLLPPGTVQAWLGDAAFALHGDITGSEALYGGGAALVRSQILLRVTPPGTPGVLAFGSRDPQAFAPGQSTDQAQFLAGVVERLLVRWQGA
ncbi:MAG TPA: DUF484 domain-containing protein [Rhodospirillaceae bacterium]|jgi:uncharacterized protein YigA (DUF484 family)|nr:DUF484 family protein [Alphaproteobacteria bacterium]HBH26111.1 DUF484 domain-containing protein [Rhodospirillaceae bacterium]